MPATVVLADPPDTTRVFMTTDVHSTNNSINPHKNDILYFHNGVQAFVERVDSLYVLLCRDGEHNTTLADAIRWHIENNKPAEVGPSTFSEGTSLPLATLVPKPATMLVSKPGYIYDLPVRRKDGNQIVETGGLQAISFLKTDAKGDTEIEGCFTEDVLKALIDRQKVLNETLPSREGALVITKLEEAMHWLGHRQTDRKERGVHMTHQS